MPNARDVALTGTERILTVGQAGAGKSTQFGTLPGKKFAYVFDTNWEDTMRGFDIDYEPFLVERTDLDLSLSAYAGKTGDKRLVSDKPARAPDPKTYVLWEKHFTEAIDSGLFKKYNWIAFDSSTLFLDAVMDRILYLGGRLGKPAELSDYSMQTDTVSRILRVISSYKAGLYMTVHYDNRQDQVTQRIEKQLTVPGRIRTRLPILFSHIFPCSSQSSKEEVKYVIQTRPDRDFPQARTTLRDLTFYEDVTVKDFKRPENYGIGNLLRKAGRLNTLTVVK